MMGRIIDALAWLPRELETQYRKAEFGRSQWDDPVYSDYKDSYLESKNMQDVGQPEFDVVFVVFEKARGWILDAICREMAQRFEGKYAFAYSARNLPSARRYFFAHYSFYSKCLKENPILWQAQSTLWHTHPRELPYSEGELVFCMKKADRISCQNKSNKKALRQKGIPASKLKLVYGAADPKFFEGHPRGGMVVGFCSAYYPRKNGNLILGIVKSMPDVSFRFAGKNWDQFEHFDELVTLSNIEYLDLEYKDYPAFYRSLDVFVSTSDLEGGPIPLIEAMMSNVVPVVSDTGFSTDLVVHGKTGFVFPTGSSPAIVCDMIERAFELDVDVRKASMHLTWERQIQICLGVD